MPPLAVDGEIIDGHPIADGKVTRRTRMAEDAMLSMQIGGILPPREELEWLREHSPEHLKLILDGVTSETQHRRTLEKFGVKSSAGLAAAGLVVICGVAVFGSAWSGVALGGVAGVAYVVGNYLLSQRGKDMMPPPLQMSGRRRSDSEEEVSEHASLPANRPEE